MAVYNLPPNIFGQNLYWGPGTVGTTTAVASWYNEIELYDYNKPKYSPQTGHFTQIVWKERFIIFRFELF